VRDEINKEATVSNWLEVSLTVNGELAEAVADVLARFAPNGVTTEQGVKFVSDEDEGTPAEPISVRAYLPVNDQLEKTRQKLEESLYYLSMIQPLPAPVYRHIADQNWMEAWKQHYHPILIGKRMIILPAWMDSTQPKRVAIKIDPGMAFGTGTHPSTILCLELLEEIVEERGKKKDTIVAPFFCIDIGCGSGILSIAALKLGAKSALGMDIDSQSIKNSRENAAINGIGKELILGVGSVKEVLEGKFPVRRAPLVLVNILAPVIVRMLHSELPELVDPGGALILSGILREQAEGVLAAAHAKGLTLNKRRQMEDWVALALKR
jgi:ribosomal protein L11 methyltransferase